MLRISAALACGRITLPCPGDGRLAPVTSCRVAESERASSKQKTKDHHHVLPWGLSLLP